MHGQIVVAGGLAQRPFYAGHTWQFLEYALGLKQLGFDVLFLDRLEPEMCRDELGRPCRVDESQCLKYFRDVMDHFGLADDWSILFDAGRTSLGLDRSKVMDRTRGSAFLLNVMGFLTDERILECASRRVFLDTDPGVGQLWRELGLHDLFRGHDDFVTIGENIGQPGCQIPTCGLKWLTMRQPVVLDLWPVAAGGEDGRFTSIVSWRGPFGPLDYRGEKYGLRVHEFRRFVDLPARTGQPFELALDIDPVEVGDLALLRDHGWSLVPPRSVAGEPREYQRYIQGSAAEFMVAKNIYVKMQCGWFSDRSTCYLASGKPVVAQDTGLTQIYPTGAGLLTFSNAEEAEYAVAEVASDYPRHCRAARAIAEEYFDSRTVFGRLLADLGIA